VLAAQRYLLLSILNVYFILFFIQITILCSQSGELALAVELRAPDARWTATCQALQMAVKRFVNSKCGTIDSSSNNGSKSKKHANGSTMTSTTLASGTAVVNLKGLVAPLPNDEVTALC
jgi:hypothetical protein